MVKQLLSKTWLLVAVLCTGATAAWADTYEKVTDVSTLAEGDKVVITGTIDNGSKIGVAGEISSGYMVKVQVNSSELTTLPNGADVFTLGKSGSNWTFTSSIGEGLLGTTAAKKVAYNSGTTTWTISITDGVATIASTNTNCGKILYNAGSPRFTTYTSNPTASMLLPILYKVIEAGSDPTKEDAGIAWSAENASVAYNAEGVYSLPTLTNPNNLTVTYSSTDSDVASIDATTGAVTIKNVNGETTISATFAGNDDYNQATVSYTLTVSKLIVIEDGVIDFTMGSDYGSGYEAGAVKVQEGTWTAGNVTLQTSGRNCWLGGNQLRLYKAYGDDPAGSMTFEVPAGNVITKIVFEGSSLANLVAENGDFANDTWTGLSQTVSFYVEDRVDINKITVTYEAVPASLTATVTAAGWATFVPKYNVKADKVNAYVVSLADDEIALLEKVTEIPADTPVLLETEGTYTLDVIESAAAVGDNCLKVSDGTISADDHVYVLGQKKGNTGFYLWTGTALDKGKVYMQTNSSNARQMLQIVKPGQEETGIEAFESASAEREGIYNLQGVRVAEPSKGLYIVGGKKVMFNK